VISDTHGLVRPEALAALRGVTLIVHAGDVGGPEVLEELERVAPVVAVRGNNDRGAWARRLPLTQDVEVGGTRIHLLHDLHDLRGDPARTGYAAVIAGHSHRPRLERRDGVLYLNPGSAGPRRFSLPIAVARLAVGPRGLRARIVELPISPA
jgi:putative phosphoesterase